MDEFMRFTNIVCKEYDYGGRTVDSPRLKLFTTQSRLLTTPKQMPFENIVGKGENVGNQHFLLFPQCFLPFTKQIYKFQSRLFCRLHMLLISTGRLKVVVGYRVKYNVIMSLSTRTNFNQKYRQVLQFIDVKRLLWLGKKIKIK